MKSDQESFAKVIDLMRHIALRGQETTGDVTTTTTIATTKNELLPLPNIAKLKHQDEHTYLEEPSTGAKISLRDAKQLVELFCLAVADTKNKIQRFIKTDEPDAKGKNVNNLDTKPNYVCVEAQKDQSKFHFAVFYMPQICMNIFRKVNPKLAFVKKKDAENHVALLAIKKLRQRGHLDAHLFPNVHGSSD